MKKSITFRHMDHVEAVERYANEHLKKIEEFLSHEPTPVYIDLVLEPSKVHAHHRGELLVKSPHYDLMSAHEGPEFYKVLDHVIDVMLEELHRAKRKRIDERNHHIKTGKLREFQEEEPEEE